jgi:hypothetical protein
MRRIGLAVVLAVGLTLAPLGAAADAQEHKAGKVYRIGVLHLTPDLSRMEAFRDGLSK